MEQLIIYKKNGSLFHTFNRVDKAEQVKEFMGQDVFNLELRSFEPISFDIGDYVEVFGERYTINLLPTERKVNDSLFEYTVKFEGIQYDLIKVQILDIDDNGFSTGATFSLIGDLEDYVKLIVRNLNRVYGPGKWSVGDIMTNTEAQPFEFNNGLETLQSICDLFDSHFYIERTGVDTYKLHVEKVETLLPDTFYYGRHKGLYSLERTNVNDKNIVTRLYAFGGTTNIMANYRGGSLRLKMPLYVIHSEGQPFITDAAAVADYGITEGSINFEDIYPKRTGTISAIDNTNRLVFYDGSMPFDLNNQLLAGLTAKINFKTGALAGYTFDVVSYNHATRKYTINPYTDERGMVFPSVDPITAFRVAVGDTYVLTDINMPQSYITAAEELLYTRALEELSIQSVPAVQWSLEIDSNYIKSKEIVPGQIINYFDIGNFVNVVDADLRINGKSQIIGFTRNFLKPYEYTLNVSEQFVNRRNIQRRRRSLIDQIRNGVFNEQITRVAAVAASVAISNNNTNTITPVVNNIQTQIEQSSNFGGREW